MRAPAWPALLLGLSLIACQAGPDTDLGSGKTLLHASAAGLRPGAVPLEQARLHFQNADYGLAERYFRQAVEQDPNNTEAWLGLAASYDHLRRFDLAERAYKVVVAQAGHTTEVHNNLGYHHYLRGNYEQAEKHFAAAREREPDNPYVQNNLRLLDASSRR